jgi:hypothetical protein
MQNTKVASFSQPAADSPVGLGDLALLWRGLAAAWFRICHFRVTWARENRRPVRAGFQLESCPVGEAASLPGSGSPGLKWPEAQQRKPVRMAVAGHQFPRAFAAAPGTAAAHKTPMVQEESQQVQI